MQKELFDDPLLICSTEILENLTLLRLVVTPFASQNSGKPNTYFLTSRSQQRPPWWLQSSCQTVLVVNKYFICTYIINFKNKLLYLISNRVSGWRDSTVLTVLCWQSCSVGPVLLSLFRVSSPGCTVLYLPY
jgi:hypothetical protein